MNDKNYKAFISYSHKDEKFAKWLHKALERYKIPEELREDYPNLAKFLFPIFRDREELPTSANLGVEILKALKNSEYLIVICSISSSKSQWVNQEIIDFKVIHGEDKVHAIILDGEPHSKGNECFPKALKYKVVDGRLSDIPTEPIAGDFRKGRDGKELGKLKLLAGLLEVKFDDLNRREERRKKRIQLIWSIFTTIMVSLLSSFVVYIYMLKDSIVDITTQIEKLEYHIKNVDLENQENNETIILLYKQLEKLEKEKEKEENVLSKFGFLEEREEKRQKNIESNRDEGFLSDNIELKKRNKPSITQLVTEKKSFKNIKNTSISDNSKTLEKEAKELNLSRSFNKNIEIEKNKEIDYHGNKKSSKVNKKIALLIANDAYSFQPLVTPLNNLDSISETLKTIGFNITILKNSSKYEIKKELANFNQRITANTIALIYFSGHSIQINNVNYIFPVTTINKAINLIDLVNLDYLIASTHSSKYRIVFLDIPKMNPLVQYFNDKKGRGYMASNELSLEGIKENKNLIIGLSGINNIDNYDEVSLYSMVLSRRLRDNKNISLILGELNSEVRNLSNYAQSPMYISTLEDTNLSLRDKIDKLNSLVFLEDDKVFESSTRRNKSLSDIAQSMALSEKETLEILNTTDLLLENIEKIFFQITNINKKVDSYEYIDEILSLFENGVNSIIEVSSVNDSSIYKKKLKRYLEDLSYKSQTSQNIYIKLDFGEEQFSENIKKTAVKMDIDINVFHFFGNCEDRGDTIKCYNDISNKTFLLNIYKEEESYRLSIESIRIKDTLSMKKTKEIP